jgi:hypothetical protein
VVFRIDGNSFIDDEWHPPFKFSEVQRVLGMGQRGAFMCQAYTDDPLYGDTSHKWTPINQEAAALPLANNMRLDVNGQPDALYPVWPNDGGLVPVMTPRALDVAYPQRLVIYTAQEFPNVYPHD